MGGGGDGCCVEGVGVKGCTSMAMDAIINLKLSKVTMNFMNHIHNLCAYIESCVQCYLQK